MDTMAIRAHSYFCVSHCQAPAVHAGVVLAQLVRAQAGVELADVGRVGMATSAQMGDLLSLNLALPPSFLTHGFIRIVAAGVAAVTTGTRQALLCVYVLAELLLGHSQRVGQSGMTIEA